MHRVLLNSGYFVIESLVGGWIDRLGDHNFECLQRLNVKIIPLTNNINQTDGNLRAVQVDTECLDVVLLVFAELTADVVGYRHGDHFGGMGHPNVGSG